MIRKIILNIKQDILSIYFIASVLLVLGVCLLSPGIGALDGNNINRPMIIEELLHTKSEYLGFHEIYNYYGLFLSGISGFLYAIFPLLSMASLSRYCDERVSGFWIQKTVRTSQKKVTISNTVASVFISIFAIILGLIIYMLFVTIRLPREQFRLSIFFPHICSICAVVALSTLIGIMVASITKSKFYSFIIPVLIYYAENEFFIGVGGVYTSLSIQSLMNPGKPILSISISIIGILLIYKIIDKMERGWHGIGI